MKLVLAALPLMLAATSSTDAGRPMPVKPPCKVAQEWVQHHPHVIPARLDGFALFPIYYKRAAYAKMTEPDRAALWQAHLAIYSGPASRLTAVQKQFIDSVSRMLPAIFADPDLSTEAGRIGNKAVKLLTKSTAHVVFASLGMVDSSLVDVAVLRRDDSRTQLVQMAGEVTPRAGGPSAADDDRLVADPSLEAAHRLSARLYYLNSTFVGAKEQAKATRNVCNCNTSGDFCDSITGPSSSCQGNNGCVDSSFGCGWLWAQSCNGICS